jgi:hypothetical protein
MPTTLTYTGALTVTSCWCGIHMAIPSSLYEMARNDGKTIYCPLGHTWVFTETEVDRLKAKLEHAETLKRIAQNQRDGWRLEAESEARSKAAIRGHLTRMRNKVANGVCPVPGCRRHFDNVQRHLQSQHEGWLAEHDVLIAST